MQILPQDYSYYHTVNENTQEEEKLVLRAEKGTCGFMKEGVQVFIRASAGKNRILEDSRSNIVGKQALMNNIHLRRVMFSNARTVGEKAFLGCTALRNASFPKLVNIKDRAFENCANLRQFTFGRSFSSMGKGTFYKCKRVRSAVFDANAPCSAIPAWAFAECGALEELVLPAHIVSLGNRACYRCVSLEDIVLPDTLEEIGDETFYQCGFSEITFPAGLRSIGDGAFRECRSLQRIRIPPSVEHIGKWAFYGCDNLKILEIRHDPQTVGAWITNRGCVVRCPRGSAMEEYAHSHGMAVKYLEPC